MAAFETPEYLALRARTEDELSPLRLGVEGPPAAAHQRQVPVDGRQADVTRIAYIGVSHWHTGMYLEPVVGTPGVELVGVSDPEQHRADEVAERTGTVAFPTTTCG